MEVDLLCVPNTWYDSVLYCTSRAFVTVDAVARGSVLFGISAACS